MTDGIIQEVCRKYYNSSIWRDSEDIVLTINALQQELIEKIIQADTKNPDWDSNFSIGVKLMKIYLIGDNQE